MPEFKFQIGDIVITKVGCEEAKLHAERGNYCSPTKHFIVGRIWEECPGGVQIHYRINWEDQVLTRNQIALNLTCLCFRSTSRSKEDAEMAQPDQNEPGLANPKSVVAMPYSPRRFDLPRPVSGTFGIAGSFSIDGKRTVSSLDSSRAAQLASAVDSAQHACNAVVKSFHSCVRHELTGNAIALACSDIVAPHPFAAGISGKNPASCRDSSALYHDAAVTTRCRSSMRSRRSASVVGSGPSISEAADDRITLSFWVIAWTPFLPLPQVAP